MSAADVQLWSRRGIVLRLSSMSVGRSGFRSSGVPLGSQRRSSPLVCSLVGRCQGLWGSQKQASIVCRLVRSTRVAAAVLFAAPTIRSPSQWPGSARSATADRAKGASALLGDYGCGYR